MHSTLSLAHTRFAQYPVLSDSAGEFRKLYGVGKGLLGLTEARVTYFIDAKGAVRWEEMLRMLDPSH